MVEWTSSSGDRAEGCNSVYSPHVSDRPGPESAENGTDLLPHNGIFLALRYVVEEFAGAGLIVNGNEGASTSRTSITANPAYR